MAPGSEGQEVTLKVHGHDLQNSNTSIVYWETEVASVRRVFHDGSGGGGWMFKPEYEVDVAGGMDIALVSYLYITIDKEESDLEIVYRYRSQLLLLLWLE